MAGTSKIAAQAEYDAGAQLIILKEWPRAIQVLERFRANNPKSEFTADVTKQARGGVSARPARPARPRWSSSASR